MNTERKRAVLSWAYMGGRWLNKVLAMSDAQVHATYNYMLSNGKLKGIHDNVSIRKP